MAEYVSTTRRRHQTAANAQEWIDLHTAQPQHAPLPGIAILAEKFTAEEALDMFRYADVIEIQPRILMSLENLAYNKISASIAKGIIQSATIIQLMSLFPNDHALVVRVMNGLAVQVVGKTPSARSVLNTVEQADKTIPGVRGLFDRAVTKETGKRTIDSSGLRAPGS